MVASAGRPYPRATGSIDTIFASLDLVPTRDGTDKAARLDVGLIGGVAFNVDDPGGAGPDSEAFFVTPQAADTYAIRRGRRRTRVDAAHRTR